ncbi:MAG: hypothetical protein ACKOYM_10340 [Actinomycetes bacterium]
MDVTASLSAAVAAEDLFAVVADLSTYPMWLDVVRSVERAPAGPEESADDTPAWWVVLQAQLGPLRRSKRLRMVRTSLDPAGVARFERRELDGRSHSPWVLGVDVGADGVSGAQVVMRLHYGGSLWMPLLDRLLAEEIERSRPRLVALVGGAA